jgi:Xaa-Pro aminopeptidase
MPVLSLTSSLARHAWWCAALLLLAGAAVAMRDGATRASGEVAEHPSPAGRVPERYDVPGERERFLIRKSVIAKRLNTVLLPAMREHGIDLWLVFSREHNVDPLLSEIGGGWGGVRNAYLFFDRGGDAPEKIFVGSHELHDRTIPETYDQVIYYGYGKDGVTADLRRLVEERDPRRIGINVSRTLPMADGLTWSLRTFLEEALGPKYASRLVSAELMVRDFRTNHIREEWPPYESLCRWTVAWEEEALSDAVVEPGRTTVADLHWWLRQRATDLGLLVEFLPNVRVTREGENLAPSNSPAHVIQPGDVISIDAGLGYLDYRTDIKRTAYVLRPGETDAPASMREAFARALRVTDLLTANMKPGEVAHEVWSRTMSQLRAMGYHEGVNPAGSSVVTDQPHRPEVGIYSHSVGNSTHDIGARVAQNWPFAYGDRVGYRLALNAWYSVELHVSTPIPEWGGRLLPIRIEEDAALTERGIVYFAPRQTRLVLIGAGGTR